MASAHCHAQAAGASGWAWLTSGRETASAQPGSGGAADGGCAGWQARYPRAAMHAAGAGPESLAGARAFARSALRRWGITGGACDDIVLVVSELLANAMSHAVPQPGGWPVRAGLLVPRPGAGVLCAVADSSPAPPELSPASDTAESGRGLHVVEQLSDRWGYTAPGPKGKIVWATFAGASPGLPQRIPIPGLAHPVRPAADPLLLARVLHCLESL